MTDQVFDEEIIPQPAIVGDDPVPYAVIDGLLPPEDYAMLLDGLPKIGEPPWVTYKNPMELKYALNAREAFPPMVMDMVNAMYSPYMLKLIPLMLNLQEEELFQDPILLGAGIHAIPCGGKLDLHLDHNRNPQLPNLERRVNAIYWIHPEWDESWGGDLELWASENGKPTECVVSIAPRPNRMALFRAGDNAFHGHPKPLTCPPDKHRISLALYYYSDILTDQEVRHKVKFVALPGEESPELEELRKQRANPDTAATVWRKE